MGQGQRQADDKASRRVCPLIVVTRLLLAWRREAAAAHGPACLPGPETGPRPLSGCGLMGTGPACCCVEGLTLVPGDGGGVRGDPATAGMWGLPVLAVLWPQLAQPSRPAGQGGREPREAPVSPSCPPPTPRRWPCFLPPLTPHPVPFLKSARRSLLGPGFSQVQRAPWGEGCAQ